ncbi:hypothetical protein M427DRAFT_71137 [Gonapodya prolifera JEL478]|uniref:Uncharacterized protein n=1 Tax=Gonapodya prolifera (strain JEL478) TaxID=1344416 RepID=A0A139AAI2_GONPJ|nr:hypothetical protein M427DRAFT_71137 [Gonapodya prolifera JEL478]|eukprot:KXS13750.1 hypothetical protein M427DRAFT_71137 [Gonapodya prolifera JEL478]
MYLEKSLSAFCSYEFIQPFCAPMRSRFKRVGPMNIPIEKSAPPPYQAMVQPRTQTGSRMSNFQIREAIMDHLRNDDNTHEIAQNRYRIVRNIIFGSSLTTTIFHVAILILSIVILQLDTSKRPEGARSATLGFAASGTIGAVFYALDAVVVWTKVWDVSDIRNVTEVYWMVFLCLIPWIPISLLSTFISIGLSTGTDEEDWIPPLEYAAGQQSLLVGFCIAAIATIVIHSCAVIVTLVAQGIYVNKLRKELHLPDWEYQAD